MACCGRRRRKAKKNVSAFLSPKITGICSFCNVGKTKMRFKRQKQDGTYVYVEACQTCYVGGKVNDRTIQAKVEEL